MERQKTSNGQHSSKAGQSMRAYDFKSYHSNQQSVYNQKNRQIYQWKNLESPEIGPQKYSQLMVNEKAKAVQWTEETGTRISRHPHSKKLI